MTATEAPHSVQCPSCESWFPIAPERVPEEGIAAICSHCMRVFRVERPAAVEVDDAAAEAFDGTQAERSGPDGPVEARDPADAVEASDAVEHAEAVGTLDFAVSEDTIDTADYAVGEEAVEDPGTDDHAELEMETVQPAPDPDDPLEMEAATTDFVEEAEDVSEADDDPMGVDEETEFGLEEEPSGVAIDLDQETSGAAIDLDADTPEAPIDVDEEAPESAIDLDEDDAASEAELEPMPEAEPMPEVEPVAGAEETGGVPEKKAAERARPEEASPVRDQSLSRAAARFGRRDPHDRAKRLARVLVSDMLTYHPARYEEALAEGTLKEHFADEIRLSWEEYEEQIGSDLAESTDYFIQALNEILARGERLFRGIGRPE